MGLLKVVDGEAWARLIPSKLVAFALALSAVLLVASRISRARAVHKFCKENGCQPVLRRHDIKDPFFGIDFTLRTIKAFREKRLLERSVQWDREIGHTFRGLMDLGTTDPENIKTILAVNFKDYSLGSRPPLMGPLLGRGIFVTDGEEWAHSRAMLRPNFVKDQVADLDMADKHIRHLLNAIPLGTTIDLQDLFHQFTLDSATEFLLGQSTNMLSDGNESSRQFGIAFDTALRDIGYNGRLGIFRYFRWGKEYADAKKAYGFCRAYVDRYVDEAMALRKTHIDEGGEARNYFLKELAKSNEGAEKIRDELLNILLAGRDTTASLLSSLFFTLARRPDIWQKLRAEVKELGGRRPSYEELRHLKYVKYCLNEALRLWPPVAFNSRFAVRDTVLPRGGGPNGDMPVYVQKGSVINYSIYAMHRRTDFYGPDADVFRPERWETLRPSWEYLPFNGGPRICLGQQYALTEAMLVVVRFAQEFSTIESKDSQPWTENLGLTVCSANGVMVSLSSAAA